MSTGRAFDDQTPGYLLFNDCRYFDYGCGKKK